MRSEGTPHGFTLRGRPAGASHLQGTRMQQEKKRTKPRSRCLLDTESSDPLPHLLPPSIAASAASDLEPPLICFLLENPAVHRVAALLRFCTAPPCDPWSWIRIWTRCRARETTRLCLSAGEGLDPTCTFELAELCFCLAARTRACACVCSVTSRL